MNFFKNVLSKHKNDNLLNILNEKIKEYDQILAINSFDYTRYKKIITIYDFYDLYKSFKFNLTGYNKSDNELIFSLDKYNFNIIKKMKEYLSDSILKDKLQLSSNNELISFINDLNDQLNTFEFFDEYRLHIINSVGENDSSDSDFIKLYDLGISSYEYEFNEHFDKLENYMHNLDFVKKVFEEIDLDFFFHMHVSYDYFSHYISLDTSLYDVLYNNIAKYNNIFASDILKELKP